VSQHVVARHAPRHPIPTPVLIAQGEDDDLVLPEVTAAFVAEWRQAGQDTDFRTYAGRGRGSIVAPDSPLYSDLLPWTRDRFAGASRPPGCTAEAA
jgi:dipeptidyl aminopeptidase/acylaminoacyl peptidase